MKDLDFGKELIRKKIPLISNSPGVYRMLDKKNQVLNIIRTMRKKYDEKISVF